MVGTPVGQRGAALLIMLLILVIGMATVLTSSSSDNALRAWRDKRSDAALAQAKAALIGFAITYADTHSNTVHGFLPCPDQAGGNPEGSAEAVCGSRNVSVLGRLPWRTLELPLQRDGYGECLWYAVAGNYKNNPKTELMNWDNDGLFEIFGNSGEHLAGADAATRAVAVIIAPGMALPGQERSSDGKAVMCGGNYGASNYLDNNGGHDNASIPSQALVIGNFVAGPLPSVNDRLAYITRAEIFDALLRRSDFMSQLQTMTRRVAECLASFGARNGYGGSANKSLPWAAPLDLSDHGASVAYADVANLLAGRVPYSVANSRNSTGNSITGDVLLNVDNCPAGWNEVDSWWRNWKDHLFYAVAGEFTPSDLPTQPCGACLCVNDLGHYAAVVMFANRRLLNQDRSDKNLLPAYLEGRNATNYPNAGGNADYESTAATSNFNDMLYCIDENLAVSPCPS